MLTSSVCDYNREDLALFLFTCTTIKLHKLRHQQGKEIHVREAQQKQ